MNLEDVLAGELSEKEKKVIGQRIAYIDYLITNAIREYGLTDHCYTVLHDLLAQMITLANAIGINVVTLKDLKKCFRESQEMSEGWRFINSPLRAELYELRAKIIAECVRQGVIESLKEIPIAVAEKEGDSYE